VNVWPFLMNGGTATAAALQPVSTDRRIFLAGGQPWRWKGVSAFPLCDRFAHGEDIDPFVDAFAGFNLLRVWDYVMWPDTGWESNPASTWLAFLDYVGARGWHVELTLLTDDDFTRVAPARQLVAALATAKPTNLVLEIGNEPREHKHIDVAALRSVCEQSGFLFASGNNAVDEPWFGSFLTHHPERALDKWPRLGHDLMEFYDGDGPDAPHAPWKVPGVNDEPIRPDQAGYVAADFKAHAGTCAQMGAGCTFHYDGGKYARLPDDRERACALATLEGLDAFPADTPNREGYRRIDEQGATMRTYVVGDSMVRVRPTTKTAPEPGWVSLDPDGILWRR
jgi:hypothetical protein